MLLSLLLRNKLLYFYEYGLNIICVIYIYIYWCKQVAQCLGSVVQQVCELNMERISAKFFSKLLVNSFVRRFLLKTAINIEKCLLRMFTFRGSDILLFIFGFFSELPITMHLLPSPTQISVKFVINLFLLLCPSAMNLYCSTLFCSARWSVLFNNNLQA